MINSKLLSSLLLLLLLLGNDKSEATVATVEEEDSEQPAISDGSDELPKRGSSAAANMHSIAECSALSIRRVTAERPTMVYFVVLDAGSTGTRAVVHKFWVKQRQPQPGSAAKRLEFKYTGSVRFKRKPGLSAFARYPRRCREQLTSLLADASASVPAELRPVTCLLLRATAGFRLMDARARHLVAKEARDVLRASEFCVPALGSVRMLSGAEEGKFAWLSVNYLLGRMGGVGKHDSSASASTTSQSKGLLTRPVLEMGGGSLQVSYQLASGDQSLAGIRVRALSYLGLGIRESVLRFLGHHDGSTRTSSGYRSPCLANGLILNFSFGAVDVQIKGTGVSGDKAAAAACLARGRQVIAELDVRPEPALRLQGNWPIYAISGFYYLVKYLHDISSKAAYSATETKIGRVGSACNSSSLSCRAYTATVGHFNRAARDACLQLPTQGDYEPYYCINLAVTDALLTDAWKLDADTPLVALGKQDALGWTLGLSLHHLGGASAATATSAMADAAAAPAGGSLDSAASSFLSSSAASHGGLVAALTAVATAATNAG